jgi:hypothetical protein
MDQRTADELLLYCLGMGADKTRAARLEQLSASDWDDLIQQSVRHGVTPLLYQRFTTTNTSAPIPATVMQRLREIYLYSAKENIRLYHELAKVLKTLQNDGISVIALKGAHLAEVVYGNIALRPMVDTDLLVRKADLSRVEEKLLEMGYGSPERPSIEEQCEKVHHLVRFTKPDVFSIEIHWTIELPTSPFEIDVDGLWERARPATIAGIEALVLSPEDLLLHLCLHVSFHHKFHIALKPFCDISETIRHYRDEIDWEQVQLRARQWQTGKYVYLTLYLARELLGAAVPDAVLNALEPNDLDPGLVTWAKEQIFTNQGHALPLSPNLVRIWEARRFQDKVAAFLKFALPSPQAMATMYPASPLSKRIYLYYPVRLKDLLLRYGRTAWRLLRHDEEMIASAEREDRGNALVDWLASA